MIPYTAGFHRGGCIPGAQHGLAERCPEDHGSKNRGPPLSPVVGVGVKTVPFVDNDE